LDDAGCLGAAPPRHGLACIAGADNRLELFARHAILLADSDCLKAPGANIGAHCSHMKAKALGHLLK
jgi:hypothetical protein